jgi:hypothetical protein
MGVCLGREKRVGGLSPKRAPGLALKAPQAMRSIVAALFATFFGLQGLFSKIVFALAADTVHSPTSRSSSSVVVVWFSTRSPAAVFPSSPRHLEFRPSQGENPVLTFFQGYSSWQQVP